MLKVIANGAVAALFAITLLIIRGDWVRQHWRYLVGSWVLAVGLWLLAMLRGKSEELPSIQTGAIQSNGQVVAPVFSGIKDSTFHITTSTAPGPEPAAPSALSSQPAPEPNLMFSGYEIQPLTFRMGTWSPFPTRTQGVIVWIENKVADEGKSSNAAYAAATIRYAAADDKMVGHVARAYWMHRTDNEITIGVGGREGILLGTRSGAGLWEIYDNPAEPLIRVARTMPRFSPFRKSLILFEDRLKIEICVIDPDSGHTLKRILLMAEDKADGTLEVRLTP
jgi:hypothetical protein